MSHVDEGTLHAYLDGELSSSERAAVDAHLGQCASCRATLTEERSLLERAAAVLSAARPVERPAPPLEQLRPAAKRSPWAVRQGFAIAASITVALGLGYYLRDLGTATPMIIPPQPVEIAQDRAAVEEQERQVARAPRGRAGTPPPAPSANAIRREAEATRRDARATPDSIVSLRGLVAAEQVRAAAPALESARVRRLDSSFRLEAVVVTATPGAAAALREQRELTALPTINRSTARTLLGTEPVGLPGLVTRSIRRSPDGSVVVEQALDSSTSIQIFQRPASEPAYSLDGARVDTTARLRAEAGAAQQRAAAPQRKAAADRLARFVGRLRVEISGPLTVDSLNRLLEQVEPLPPP